MALKTSLANSTSSTRSILQVAQYNWVLIPLFYCFVYRIAYYFLNDQHGGIFQIDDNATWNWSYRFYLLITAPSKPLTIMYIVAYCFPLYPFHLSKQPVKRQFKRLIICLVTRGDQVPVVKRSITAVQDMYLAIDNRISLYILTEEANANNFQGMFKDHVSVLGVPMSYRAKKARYKARSLEWFRIKMQLLNDDWVLHIDEETILDEYALRTCIDFITRQDYADMGQGIIHFNSYNYWGDIVPTVGDIGRIKGDWGLFQWRANWLHQAAIGVRGSFILLSGAVENAVTWETESMTEDYSFCLTALEKGFRIGWVPAIAREISPSTVYDYIRQRRRWYTGIHGVGDFCGQYTLFCVVISAITPLYYAYWIINKQWTVPVPVPRWMYNLTVFEMIADPTITFLLVFLQDWDGGVRWYYMLRNQILVLLIQPYILLLDAYAVISSLWNPEKWFYVIEKK